MTGFSPPCDQSSFWKHPAQYMITGRPLHRIKDNQSVKLSSKYCDVKNSWTSSSTSSICLYDNWNKDRNSINPFLAEFYLTYSHMLRGVKRSWNKTEIAKLLCNTHSTNILTFCRMTKHSH
jgi:hypothetical protein